MKILIAILFNFIFYLVAVSQDQKSFIQVTGSVMRPPNDTIILEVFTDGETIDRKVFIGKFYSFEIGYRLLYIAKITSGNKVKYCYINTNFMATEKIIVDVDFSSNFHSEIYLDKPNDKYFTMRLYDRYRSKFIEIERTYSEY